jgi:hypothetical protein
MLENLFLYLQNEVAFLNTAPTISCKDFSRETGQRAARSAPVGDLRDVPNDYIREQLGYCLGLIGMVGYPAGRWDSSFADIFELSTRTPPPSGRLG